MEVIFVYLKAFNQTGGIEAFNKRFIKALEIREGFDFPISVKVISVYDNTNSYISHSGHLKFFGFDGNKFEAFKFLVKSCNKKTLVFYGHLNLLPFPILLSLINFNNRACFIIHGIEAWVRFPFLKRYFLKKFKFLAVSNYTKNSFSDKNFVDPSKIQVFPNSIEMEEAIEQSVNPYLQSDFNILSVSRLDSDDNYKGIDTMIKVVHDLKEIIPNIKYTIIGKGKDKERLEKLVNKYDLSKYVEFKGYVVQIEAYFKNCDLFALPSSGEGFGIVYLEAMKYSKPVLAAKAGGATDVVLQNETGYLCEYNDQKDIAEKIKVIFNNPKLSQKLGVNGYNHLKRDFTFDSFQKRLHTYINFNLRILV